MLKQIIFILLLLFICGSCFAQLTALQKIPSTVSAGSSFIVKTNINRSKINGFMKFSQAFPEGFEATEMDSKSGDFRYEANEVKIVWLTPPSEVLYTVTYKVKVPAAATGSYTIEGKIVFITANNERKAFTFPPQKLTISDKPEIAEVKVKADVPDKKVNKPVVVNIVPHKKTETPVKVPTPVTAAPAIAVTYKKNYGYLMGGLETPLIHSRKPLTIAASKKNYKVQIGAFKLNPKITGVPEHSTALLNGITKHFSGHFSTYEAAAERKKEMIDKGFQGAFIVELSEVNKDGDNRFYSSPACVNWWECVR